MLLDRVVNHANFEYLTNKCNHRCKDCKNPKQYQCDSCRHCLSDIHFFRSDKNSKNDYDCINLINFYVCNYSHKYASEILYLLRECDYIRNLDEYKILSLGCGPCPDLMAFEKYLIDSNSEKKISYIGIDKNCLWKSTHEYISNYKSPLITELKYFYVDATKFELGEYISNTNIIVFQFFISIFYAYKRENEIDRFFELLIDDIYKNRNINEPFIILFSDANNKKMGRKDFELFFKKLKKKGLKVRKNRFYFRLGKFPRYGKSHKGIELLFPISDGLERRGARRYCKSAQMIIEILPDK